MRTHTWQDIQTRIRSNIASRKWSPGDLIPGEVALAEEFGCSRTTVNRALRELAATGIIDRKRKSGTRVAVLPARHVRAEIPIIRAQVNALERAYSFKLLESKRTKPEQKIRKLMKIENNVKALHVRSIHLADGLPFVYEDRWINTQTIPDIKSVDFSQISANEWLVHHVPFTKGQFVVQATNANKRLAKALDIEPGTAVLTSQRTTWLDEQSVTTVMLSYLSSYQMQFEI